MHPVPPARCGAGAVPSGPYRIAMHHGVIGYFCACGNAEVLDHEHYFYSRFRAHARDRGPNGTPLITCLLCLSPAHEPSAQPLPP